MERKSILDENVIQLLDLSDFDDSNISSSSTSDKARSVKHSF